ncbi:hypothetical protein [Aureliella helgolandensis]|nr:hypothetical protein [Aureliella helgolandensis]
MNFVNKEWSKVSFSQMRVLGCLACCTFFLVGCGPDLSHLPPTVTAEGIVTLDGAPVEGAQVVFISMEGESASAASDSSGKFALRAFDEKPGAIPGTYKVQVSKTIAEATGKQDPDGGDIIKFNFGVPKKYTGIGTSGLEMTVPEAGSSDLKIELVTK